MLMNSQGETFHQNRGKLSCVSATVVCIFVLCILLFLLSPHRGSPVCYWFLWLLWSLERKHLHVKHGNMLRSTIHTTNTTPQPAFTLPQSMVLNVILIRSDLNTVHNLLSWIICVNILLPISLALLPPRIKYIQH